MFWIIRYLRISPFSSSLNFGSAFKLWHFIFVFVAVAASACHIYSKNCVEVYVSDRVGFGHMFSQDRRVDDRSGSGTPRLELKQNLKTSRKGYKGHVTKIRNEIEALMVSQEYECVRGKLANLEPAFSNFRRAHKAYVQCLDDPEEIFEATTWFEDFSNENRRFVQRVEKWLDGSQRLPLVDANDSASQYGSSSVFRKSPSSVSKAISRLTVKVKEAKVEGALAELKMQQLKNTRRNSICSKDVW